MQEEFQSQQLTQCRDGKKCYNLRFNEKQQRWESRLRSRGGKTECLGQQSKTSEYHHRRLYNNMHQGQSPLKVITVRQRRFQFECSPKRTPFNSNQSYEQRAQANGGNLYYLCNTPARRGSTCKGNSCCGSGP